MNPSWEKLEKNLLPLKEDFYISLNHSNREDEDYEHKSIESFD